MSVPGGEPIVPPPLPESSTAARAARQWDYSRRFPSIAETLRRVRAELDDNPVPSAGVPAADVHRHRPHSAA
ncbi:hypothetical protein [Amycolatopsis sp. H20-H5]|uniref:hypothetical protein n=1 Tax=Amycolatopsis sp. H20-H5 TaxID=3046309 RepID=UPI002DBA25CB|nr:hypothetical protein [Amycolatopsis sp. H20-H5]MEC3981659.1 hypothetical protein [Amycolatopsis sp. H20-H5]